MVVQLHSASVESFNDPHVSGKNTGLPNETELVQINSFPI